MKYLSVCSGIEAATVAWHPLGWEPVAFSEIEPFPSAVLDHHYPHVPNLGDMSKFKEWNLAPINLLVGGTPCQSFSVAGLRKGLDDPRGNLMLTYLAIADQHRPRWLVWENVPGVLSSDGGRDFGTFLGGLAELGYGFAYRVLDAQYFGVAQRRRRVFVVGHLGDWRPAAAVLFERDSLSGNPAPCRQKGKSVASSTGTGIDDGGETIGTLLARDHKGIATYDLSKAIVQPAYGIPGNWIGRKPENGGNATEPMHDVAPCLTKADQHGVAQPIPINSMNAMRNPDAAASTGCGLGEEGEAMFTLTKTNHHAVAQPTIVHGTQDPCVSDIAFAQGRNNGGENVMVQAMAVRRLTPVECERLQGFPDDYTNIPWRRSEESPDGPRYKALGNSMAVPVMRWIGERIKKVEAIK